MTYYHPYMRKWQRRQRFLNWCRFWFCIIWFALLGCGFVFTINYLIRHWNV